MSQQPSSLLEDHPDGTGDLNPIINGNWHKINNYVNPGFLRTLRQDDGTPPGAGTKLTASSEIFTADDVGAQIIWANKATATIASVTDSTHADATDSKEITAQSFTIYRATETEYSVFARGLLKRVRLVAGDDGMVPVWDNTLGRFKLITRPGFGVTAGQILFGKGAGQDAGGSADLTFDDSTDILAVNGKVDVAKTIKTGHAVISSATNIALDFKQEQFRSINTLQHNVTFTTTNVEAGRALFLRIIADGSTRNFTFPAWRFVGAAAPANIAASKAALLQLRAFGTTDGDIVAKYDVEP